MKGSVARRSGSGGRKGTAPPESIRLAAVAHEAEQHQEQVDEVEVEGQRAEQGAAADGCGVVERGVFAEGADLWVS